MPQIEIRPACAADVARLDKPLPYRSKAWSVWRGDEFLGLGGIGFTPEHKRLAFVFVTDEGRKHPVALHKAGRFVMQQARDMGFARLFAIADPTIEAADRWLERLGFHFLGVFGDGERFWQWTNDSSGSA